MESPKSINKYSETVLSVPDAMNLLLQGKQLGGVLNSEFEAELFNKNVNRVLNKSINIAVDNSLQSVDEYHEHHANVWFMPSKYKDIDVLEYLLAKCKTDTEVTRVHMEYALYEERSLEVVLQFFIFLVDHMREHNFIWGVGRGSSVASYCLYLIGIHKIDSIKYNLDITEYLKE